MLNPFSPFIGNTFREKSKPLFLCEFVNTLENWRIIFFFTQTAPGACSFCVVNNLFVVKVIS